MKAAQGEIFPSSKLLKNLLIFLLVVTPPVLLLIFVKLLAVNVPFADDWDLVPLMEKLHSGTLTAKNLFAVHNEHRMPFPKAIMLLIAELTQGNTVAIMCFSWGLQVLSLLMIFAMFREAFGGSASSTLKFIPISWLLFTFRQYESILIGFAINIYLCSFGFLASMYMLSKKKEDFKKDCYCFFAALCFGILSSFSTINGLLVWPVGAFFLVCSGAANKRLFGFLWISAGLAVSLAYFSNWNWGATSLHPADLSAFLQLPAALAFLILNVGAPLAFVKSSAGAMGAVIFIYMVIVVLLVLRDDLSGNCGWVALILFSIGSSFLLTVGRMKFGLSAALASRYAPFTVIGIIGLYCCALSLYEKSEDKKNQFAIFYGAVLSAILIGLVSGYSSGVLRGREIHEARKAMAYDVLNYDQASDGDLEEMAPDVTKLRKEAQILEDLEYSVFRKN